MAKRDRNKPGVMSDREQPDVVSQDAMESRVVNPQEATSIMPQTRRDVISWRDVEPWIEPAGTSEGLGRLGDFLLIRLLGRGAMGVVFEATDTNLNRTVAIKILSPGLLADETALQRFQREARAIAAVKHAGIVQIHQVGETRGLPYIVMEYVAGRSLSEYVKLSGRLPYDEAIRLTRELMHALKAAHEAGLVHRDVKPSNILLEAPDHHVKLTDFGLTRGTEDLTVTESGALVGTPAYMAPEMLSDEGFDARADLFSVGATLYHMLAGKSPFAATTTMSTFYKITQGKFEPLASRRPDCPAFLSEIINTLLQRHPDDRFQSSEQVLAALDQEKSIPRRRFRRMAKQWTSPSLVTVLAAAVVLVSITAFTLFAWSHNWFGPPGEPPPPPPDR